MIPNINSGDCSHPYESDLLQSIGFHSNNYLDCHVHSLGNELRNAFYENIESHKKEALKILSNFNELKISIDQLGIYTENPNTSITEKKYLKNHGKLKEFCEFTEKRMLFDHILRSNMDFERDNLTDASNWHLIVKQDGVSVIQDKEWPLIASFIQILIANPYSKIPYSTLIEFCRPFFEARKLRLGVINSVSHYELYSKNKLIFKKSGNNFEFHDKKLFTKLCTPLKNSPWLTVIDEEFIKNAIKKGYAPKDCRRKLEKYKGFTIEKALEESGVYGNRKRIRKIYDEELKFLLPLDQFIFTNIQHQCNKDLYSKEYFKDSQNAVLSLKQDYSTWNKVKKQYKYLDSDSNESPLNKIKKIYKYLSGKIEAASLNLCSETFLDVLKFVKMFDLAISLSNCMRLKKINFERGSYQLRKMIMEKTNLLSHVVFSKTLIDKKILEISYLANSKNWLDERVGMHAKLYANSMILAASLSERIRGSEPNPKLISCRANTAAGKTTFLGHAKGNLNSDDIKYCLRKGTEIKNHQIHFEGVYAIFEHLFKQVANYKFPHFGLNSTMTGLNVSYEMLHYKLDSRLIKLEYVKEYLVEPAKKRYCTIALNDLDVPLLTTFNRVLNRNPKGKDPIPSLMAMVTGFKEIRQYRKEIVEYVTSEDLIEEYNLYHLGKIVATKTEKDKIEILDHKYYEECFNVPTDQTLGEILDRVIDEKYIQEAILRGCIKEEDSGSLECWKGKTVQFAIEELSNCL